MRRSLVFFSIISIIWSCSSESQRDLDVAVNTCEDVSLAQMIYADAYKLVRFAALGNRGISDSRDTTESLFGCDEVIVDTTTDPKSIIIDFKFTGCEGLGVSRSGRIQADFFGTFGEEGSAVDINFSNYFYETYEVSGLVRVIFQQDLSDGRKSHTFYVQNGSINDGTSEMTWTASQTWKLPVGMDIQEYHIEGSNNGVNRKGNVFFASTKTDNLMTDSCQHVTLGAVEIEITNLSNRLLNFGSGNCDKNATATINDATHQVSLP